MWSIVTAPLKLTAVSNNSKSNECAYRLFIESFNCSLGPCLSQETIEGSDQENWFANAGGAVKQRGLPCAWVVWGLCRATGPWPAGVARALGLPAGGGWSEVCLLREHLSGSQVALFLIIIFIVVSLDDIRVLPGGLKRGKKTSKISQNFQEVHVIRDRTGSNLRKGSKGKHTKLILWKAYLAILQFGAIVRCCTVVRLVQILRN